MRYGLSKIGGGPGVDDELPGIGPHRGPDDGVGGPHPPLP